MQVVLDRAAGPVKAPLHRRVRGGSVTPLWEELWSLRVSDGGECHQTHSALKLEEVTKHSGLVLVFNHRSISPFISLVTDSLSGACPDTCLIINLEQLHL